MAEPTLLQEPPDFSLVLGGPLYQMFMRTRLTGANPGIGKFENGWMLLISGMGDYGTNYDARAGIAVFGIGANLVTDAFYPIARVDGDGQLLNGANKYVVHFDKGQTPPLNALWSLTMYNAKQGFVANPINRYTIGTGTR
jgi:hypothetical protein